MLGTTLEVRANEITSNVPPLALESKERDTQWKKAAPDGEKELSLAELTEFQKTITAITQRRKEDVKRTPARTTLSFPRTASPERPGQLGIDLLRSQAGLCFHYVLALRKKGIPFFGILF